MVSLLLALIYLTFISLGLPDSLLGSAWPVMYIDLNTSLSSMGIITMIVASGTIISSLFSDKLIKRFKTGLVVSVSVLFTCLGLFGFSISTRFYMLCLFAIPYGLGAGAIDSTLNNYVALHYTSRHMSWLHCFWGVGTIISPYIMAFSLTNFSSWNLGYRIVAIIQTIIALILFATLPVWKKAHKSNISKEDENLTLTFKEKLKIKNIFYILIGFFAYCSFEATMMGWSSTYMVEVKGIVPETAASLASLFFIGITIGRFICGFISNKFGDKLMIRIGQIIIMIGFIALAIPFKNYIISLSCFLLIGFGCGPIYPSIIHSTPYNFSKDKSQAIIGLQMASAYIGSTFMPPLFGLIAQYIDCGLFPYYGLCFLLLDIIMLEILNYKLKNKNKEINI